MNFTIAGSVIGFVLGVLFYAFPGSSFLSPEFQIEETISGGIVCAIIGGLLGLVSSRLMGRNRVSSRLTGSRR
jgi:uncharacterized membrane protein YdjX (TVP38/TMEM64 family)